MSVKAKAAQVFAFNGLIWVPILVGVAAICFFAFAGYLALVPIWGEVIAAAATGGALTVVAGLISYALALLIAPKAVAPPPPQQAETSNSVPASIDEAVRPVIGDAASDWIENNALQASLGALAVGVAIAASPKLRNSITRIAGPLAARKLAKYLD